MFAKDHNQSNPLATRQAGVCLHISSLPGRYGIGEIGSEARAFIDRMKRMQLGVWQFLPLGPTAYADSPYQPLSSFAGNELFIDIEDLISKDLLHVSEASKLTDLPKERVDYGRLIPIKMQLLSLAASRFETQASPQLKTEYREFLQQHDWNWLRDYALFRVLKSQHDERPWWEWAPEFVHREDAAVRAFGETHADDIAVIKIVQFLFRAQWQQLRDYANARGIRLFGDLPIYIALDSADAWANRDLLRIDDSGRPEAVAGVPPDYFSDSGQLWGNPLYDWQKHEATGFAWWIERLRASTKLVDIVRIDHFRGFESYWAVPAGSDTARAGTWEPGPCDRIFDAMRDAIGALPIVAEDLGMITHDVEVLRDRQQFPGMVVLQFSVCKHDFALAQVPENCVCYTGTHDNDTTLGWFQGSNGDMRSADDVRWTRNAVLALTDGAPETIAMDLVASAFSTNARLAIAPMQDYLGLGSEARFNTPGTSTGNWRWRMTAAQLTDDVCDNVANAVRASRRETHDD